MMLKKLFMLMMTLNLVSFDVQGCDVDTADALDFAFTRGVYAQEPEVLVEKYDLCKLWSDFQATMQSFNLYALQAEDQKILHEKLAQLDDKISALNQKNLDINSKFLAQLLEQNACVQGTNVAIAEQKSILNSIKHSMQEVNLACVICLIVGCSIGYAIADSKNYSEIYLKTHH